MTAPHPYIAIAVIALAIIAVLLRLVFRRGGRRLTPLTGLAFGCIIGGIAFGDTRWLGHGLIGAGVLLAIADIIVRSRT